MNRDQARRELAMPELPEGVKRWGHARQMEADAYPLTVNPAGPYFKVSDLPAIRAAVIEEVREQAELVRYEASKSREAGAKRRAEHEEDWAAAIDRACDAVLKRGPYGPTVIECPDCEGGGEMADPCCKGTTCCERCDGSGEVNLKDGVDHA